jgi:ATP-binding cassette subfamily F protein 3
VIIVSHDRDFLQGLTTKVYAFKDHKIKEYQGDVTEYLQKFRLETLKQLEQNESVKNEKIASVSENKLKYEQKKELERKIRKLTKQIETCEQEIEHLENEMTLINEQLSNPEKYKEEIQSGTLYKHHREIEKQLTDTMEQWERLSLEVETLKQQKD